MAKKLIIYSIPKCGTHFLSQITALLLNPNCNIYDKSELYKYVVHLTKKDFINNNQIDRPFFCTHPGYLSYDKIDLFPHKKIFIIRNPLDKIISSYFYRIYYRANSQELNIINENMNQHIFDYCLKNIETFSNQIIRHIKMSKVTNNAVLFNYGTVFDNKEKFIRIMADMMEVQVNDKLVALIYDKTDIQKCSEYESKHRSFNVGAMQNGLFFRQGGNKNYEKYLDLSQIERLKREIPQCLHDFYTF